MEILLRNHPRNQYLKVLIQPLTKLTCTCMNLKVPRECELTPSYIKIGVHDLIQDDITKPSISAYKLVFMMMVAIVTISVMGCNFKFSGGL